MNTFWKRFCIETEGQDLVEYALIVAAIGLGLTAAAGPEVDRLSDRRVGGQWFACEWLSDVVLGGAHRIAGLPGVALLAALAIALTAWGAARLSLSLGGNMFFTAAAMVLLLGTT